MKLQGKIEKKIGNTAKKYHIYLFKKKPFIGV